MHHKIKHINVGSPDKDIQQFYDTCYSSNISKPFRYISQDMALYHFKQHIMEEEHNKQKEQNLKIHIHNDNIFTNNRSEAQYCGHKNPNVMFEGINLGDVMRQTLLLEMNFIRTEEKQKFSPIWGF